jgi:hypothetical protein
MTRRRHRGTRKSSNSHASLRAPAWAEARARHGASLGGMPGVLARRSRPWIAQAASLHNAVRFGCQPSIAMPESGAREVCHMDCELIR